MAIVLSVWVLVVSAFVGCAHREPRVAQVAPAPAKQRKKVVAPATRDPLRSSGHTAPPPPSRAPAETADVVGMSWYAYGTGTESGEPFDPWRATCATATAHALRRFVTLRNPMNGRRVRAWLNDTGLFGDMRPPRTYDCTPRVWSDLGFPLSAGVVSVEVVAA